MPSGTADNTGDAKTGATHALMRDDVPLGGDAAQKDPLLASEVAPSAATASTVMDIAPESEHTAGLSSQAFMVMGLSVTVGIAIFFVAVVIAVESVVIALEFAVMLMILTYIPVGIGHILHLHQDIDRNVYPRLTNLPIWKLVENDKICYGFLGACVFLSLLEIADDNWRTSPNFIYTLKEMLLDALCFVKATALLVVVSRKLYQLLVRWTTMREGSQRRVHLLKVALVVSPAALDLLMYFADDGYRYISGFAGLSGCFINIYLVAAFVACVLQYLIWLRHQNMRQVVASWKRQVADCFRRIHQSAVVQKFKALLASMLQANAGSTSRPQSPTSAPLQGAAHVAAV